mmetsp:Transcript_45526/g.147955  ORF Transcript_45526/g.147955 Transcript_45526/m.147955 type:complete len:305 (-) Transcript_45526:387-1301(-)
MALPRRRVLRPTYRRSRRGAARGALARHWQVGRIARRRAEGGQRERQQDRGERIRVCRIERRRALMQRPGWLREDIMLQFGSAAFASASACACPPVVVALPAYAWSTAAVSCVRRIHVMSCLWLYETKCALAAPGSMSTYMDDPLGSVGSGTTATSTLSGTRITPLTSGAAASMVGRMRQVCVPSVMDQTERKTRSRCWKNLERPESFRVVACSTCSKHGPQSLTHHGTPPPSDSTRTCPMTPSASPHCPSVWRTAAATIAGMTGTPSATARQSSRPPRCRHDTCMFPCDDMTVQLSAAASSAS